MSLSSVSTARFQPPLSKPDVRLSSASGFPVCSGLPVCLRSTLAHHAPLAGLSTVSPVPLCHVPGFPWLRLLWELRRREGLPWEAIPHSGQVKRVARLGPACPQTPSLGATHH